MSQDVKRLISLAVTLLFSVVQLSCKGSAVGLHNEGSIGDSTIGDGGTRSDGADLGAIYQVTKVVEATAGIPGWADSDLPLNSGPYPKIPLGTVQTNKQVPFHFAYTYPPNNYKLNEANLVLTTSRDNSNTEGIFVDGVLTGRLPVDAPSTSAKITHRYYECNGGCTSGGTPSTPTNRYYMDYSLRHYTITDRQMVNLRIADLLAPTTVTEKSVLNDGQLNVVTGDDSPIYQALLFYQGYTISKTPPVCTNSATYNFENRYIHNDGNSISNAAFTGTVKTPFQSWGGSRVSDQSVEFYFDPKFPAVNSLGNITVTEAKIQLRVKRDSPGNLSAIVVNGVGVAQPGFNRTVATAAVDSWIDAGASVSAWEAKANSVTNNDTDTSIVIDLNAIFGANKIRDLIAQGKLNVAIYGGLSVVYGAGNTSALSFSTPEVDGPRLVLKGTFFTQVCEVPNNPNSPLTDDNPLPTGGLDQTSPVVSSVQATEITSTSAVIQWLTDEGSDTQVVYGLTDPPTTASALDSTAATFHRVQLTGLSPFKYYFYQVKSKDASGNETIYATKVFRTLR